MEGQRFETLEYLFALETSASKANGCQFVLLHWHYLTKKVAVGVVGREGVILII